MKCKIEAEAGELTVEATDAWEAAGSFAAAHAGFGCDEPCWDSFEFSVNDVVFFAQLETVLGPGTGTVLVSQDNNSVCTTRVFDQNGTEC